MSIRGGQGVCLNDVEEYTFAADRGCAQMVFIGARYCDIITKK